MPIAPEPEAALIGPGSEIARIGLGFQSTTTGPGSELAPIASTLEATQIEPLYPKLPCGRRGPNGLSKAQVAADQRRRMQGAMIEAVARHGYRQTTVREVCKLAGVSERAFYEQYPERKQGCFLAAYDAIVERGVRRIGAAYRADDAWQAKLRAAFDAYAAEVLGEPRAARLVLVEVFGAGPVALQRMRATRLIFERIVSASFDATPDGVALPPPIAKGIVCGVERITRQRLLAGRERELADLADELLAWALSFRSPALPALAGAVKVHAQTPLRKPPPLGVENEHARILRATARIAAADGYARLTPARIVRAAGVPEARFDELYAGVEQCFLDALDRLGLQALVCAAGAARTAPGRAVGLHRGMAALLDYIASDPVLVRVAFVEIFALGSTGIARREQLLGRFADLLARSLPPGSQTSGEVSLQASVGAIWGVVHYLVIRGATRQLPKLAGYATYLALAPAIGAEAAVDVALSGGNAPARASAVAR